MKSQPQAPWRRWDSSHVATPPALLETGVAKAPETPSPTPIATTETATGRKGNPPKPTTKARTRTSPSALAKATTLLTLAQLPLTRAYHNLTNPSSFWDSAYDVLYEGTSMDITWSVDPSFADEPVTITLRWYHDGVEGVLEEIATIDDASSGTFTWPISRGPSPLPDDYYMFQISTPTAEQIEFSRSDWVLIFSLPVSDTLIPSPFIPDPTVATTLVVPSTTADEGATATDDSQDNDSTATDTSPTDNEVTQTGTLPADETSPQEDTPTTSLPLPPPPPTPPPSSSREVVQATTKTEDGTRIVIETISGQTNTFTLGPSGETLFPTPSPASPPTKKIAAIVGGVLGGLILLFFIAGLLWWRRRRAVRQRALSEGKLDKTAEGKTDAEREVITRDAEGRPVLDVKVSRFDPIVMNMMSFGREGLARQGTGKEGALKRWRSRRMGGLVPQTSQGGGGGGGGVDSSQ